MSSGDAFFPDRQFADARIRTALILIVPSLYLIATLLYSSQMAVWGRQVDPESAYTMNGLVAAAGYGSMKYDHPGTTTTLLVELIVRVWAFVARAPDIVEFGLRHYDAITHAARTSEALVLTASLATGGLIVARATGSAIAAMLFQAGPLVHADTFHFEMVLIPESLMVSIAMLGLALVIKAALDEEPPSPGLGALSGLMFALGFSTKYLYLPLAALGVCLLRSPRALKWASVVGAGAFVGLNLAFNPGTITRGFGWLTSIATHKGRYGEGEAGFVDLAEFWSNMGEIVTAAPLVFAIFLAGGLAGLIACIRRRSWSDPVSLTLIAAFLVYGAQLAATSKHFALHYMMASWVLAGGVLVLLIVQIRRLVPAIPATALAAVAGAMCVVMAGQTFAQIRREALQWSAWDAAGARLSQAVAEAGPACANVSAMFVHAPENDMNHGFDMTLQPWGDQQKRERFSEAYGRAFAVPLLDHGFYTRVLKKNFRPTTYAKLAAEYPCIVLRINETLDAASGIGLLDLNPDHCAIAGIQVYTVGIACAKIEAAYARK